MQNVTCSKNDQKNQHVKKWWSKTLGGGTILDHPRISMDENAEHQTIREFHGQSASEGSEGADSLTPTHPALSDP